MAIADTFLMFGICVFFLRKCREPPKDASPNWGRLAQLVERLVYTEDVGGSSPSSPTILLT